jgi:hypothetical protein
MQFGWTFSFSLWCCVRMPWGSNLFRVLTDMCDWGVNGGNSILLPASLPLVFQVIFHRWYNMLTVLTTEPRVNLYWYWLVIKFNDRSVPCACRSQAAELGEFTAKIALLEEAKRKKEEEATEWQHKVTVTSSTSLWPPHAPCAYWTNALLEWCLCLNVWGCVTSNQIV